MVAIVYPSLWKKPQQLYEYLTRYVKVFVEQHCYFPRVSPVCRGGISVYNRNRHAGLFELLRGRPGVEQGAVLSIGNLQVVEAPRRATMTPSGSVSRAQRRTRSTTPAGGSAGAWRRATTGMTCRSEVWTMRTRRCGSPWPLDHPTGDPTRTATQCDCLACSPPEKPQNAGRGTDFY